MVLTRHAALPLALLVGGCAAAVDTIGEPFVQPGKFNFLRCQEIAQQIAFYEGRSKELHELIDKANAGVGGSAVSMFVYGPDLQDVDAELRLLHKTAGEKRCDDDKPQPAAQPQAAAPAAAASRKRDPAAPR
jgi:hypothetical protein